MATLWSQNTGEEAVGGQQALELCHPRPLIVQKGKQGQAVTWLNKAGVVLAFPASLEKGRRKGHSD